MIKQPDPLAKHDRNEVDHDLIDQTGLEALLIDARLDEADFFVTSSLLGSLDDG